MKRRAALVAALGTAAVVAGGVLGAVTAASFFLEVSLPGRKPAPAADRAQVTLMAEPRAVGLLVQGVWGGRR